MDNNLLPISDKVTEEYVLGTLLTESNAYNDVKHLLSEDCFTDDLYKKIYSAICQIKEKGDRADMITVRPYVGNENAIKLVEICECHTFNIEQYSARLLELSIRRKFFDIGYKLINASKTEDEDIVDIQKTAVDNLKELFNFSNSKIYTIDDTIMSLYNIVASNKSGNKKITGTKTGFQEIDKRCGGLQSSDLTIIAGETSQGKSSLAISIADNAAKSGAKIAIYSMEMTKEQIAARMLSIESGIPASVILYSPLSDSQFQALDSGSTKISGTGIYFDDSSNSRIDNILLSIRNMKIKYDIDGVIIDYLQLISSDKSGATKEQQVGDMARRLKNIAKEIGIWVIALSQLSRNKENPTPTKSRLRDSGQIEEAADNIILIYRPEAYGRSYSGEFSEYGTSGTAMIDFAKGRNVGVFKFICGFDSSTTQFYPIDNKIDKKNNDIPF